MKNGIPDPLQKPVRSRSRDVSSRFLSPFSTTDTGVPSPVHALSPVRRKSSASSSDFRKLRNTDETAPIRSLWPSSTSTKKSNTLADHLGNERLIDFIERKNSDRTSKTGLLFGRQRSCSEFNRFENEKGKERLKENRPISGSARYTSKFRFSGNNNPSSASLTPGRISVDENAMSRRKSDSFIDLPSSESDASAATDLSSACTGRNQKAGIEVPARFLQDPSIARTRRGSESSNPTAEYTKNGTKRSNSLTAYASATSQWALSPGRTVSPPISGDSKGKLTPSYSSLRPPSPSSKHKGMGNLISLGLELFKSKKSSSSSAAAASTGFASSENVHQLRLLHNRLLQWRFVNARADAVNKSKAEQTKCSLLNAWATLSQLQSTVMQKRIQLEKEKLELKLKRILNSQIKPLDSWADMEKKHTSAVSVTWDCIQSVVCRVPLIEGAKADPQPISVTLCHAADRTASITTVIRDFSSMAQMTVPLICELAKVVTRERALLEECSELLGVLANLELKERSLKCHIIQLKSKQQQPQQLQPAA